MPVESQVHDIKVFPYPSCSRDRSLHVLAYDVACHLTLLETPDPAPLTRARASRALKGAHAAQLLLSCLQPFLALVQVQMSSEKIFVLTVGLPPRHRAFEHKADPKLLEAVEAQLQALPGQLAEAGIEAKNVFMGPGVYY